MYVGSVNGKIVRKGMEAGRGVHGQGGFQNSEQRIYVEGKERGAKWAALSEPTELQVRGKTVTVHPGGVQWVCIEPFDHVDKLRGEASLFQQLEKSGQDYRVEGPAYYH